MTQSSDSYSLLFYNNKYDVLIEAQWDKSLLNKFAHRVGEAVLPNGNDGLKEPWFEYIYHSGEDETLQRHPIPQGLTSLKGERFEPEEGLDLSWYAKSKIKFFTLKIYDLNEKLFEGQYSVEDVFRSGAELVFKKMRSRGSFAKEEGPFFYEIKDRNRKGTRNLKITILSDNSLFPKEAYEGQDVFRLPKREDTRKRIRFNRVKREPLEVFNADKFPTTQEMGHRGKSEKGKVLIRQEVYDELVKGMKLSNVDENGGYLIGHPYRMPDSPESETDEDFRWAIEITDVIKAEGAYGNPSRLLFTHDTWSKLKVDIDTRYSDKQLLSWFHTHLFEATDDFGLSGMDQDLHRQFFTKPWQVALLLNINKGVRELRCFQRHRNKNKLVESTFEIIK